MGMSTPWGGTLGPSRTPRATRGRPHRGRGAPARLFVDYFSVDAPRTSAAEDGPVAHSGRARQIGPAPVRPALAAPARSAQSPRTHRTRPGPAGPAAAGPAPPNPPSQARPRSTRHRSRPRRSAPLRSSRSEHLPQLLAEPFDLHRDARPAQGIRGDQESLLKQRRSGQPGDLGAVVDVPAGTGDPE